MMFFGESLCYLIFILFRKINWLNYQREMKLAKKRNLHITINPFHILLPTVFDLFTSSFAFFGL
jgi:hypothetical protein